MLQDIQPHVYDSEFRKKIPEDQDILILQRGRELLLTDGSCAAADTRSKSQEDGSVPEREGIRQLPTVGQIRVFFPKAVEKAFYLFSIDDQGYYAFPVTEPEDDPLSCPGFAARKESFSWQSVMSLREMTASHHSFGGAVGWHLASWYSLHRFCGRCGGRTVHSETERAILCPACGHAWYPRISPVVIIAITDGDRILLTRYNRNGYRRHALVAGFVEIGETLEDAVRREVMEEVGLRVKNIRYIESQPWPFSSSLIAGFQADVDGDPAVRLNTDGGDELAEAVWIDRKDLEIEDTSVSLTWDMIRKFRNGELSP